MNEKMIMIDEFLKKLKDISLENPNFYFNDQEVYYFLTQLGLPKEEENVLIEEHFDTWVKHFIHNPNCFAFVDENWKYFCQFISKECVSKSYLDYIKLYIPLDSKHIEKGAKLLFDFLSRENIMHVSKIGKHVRFDDIVVRLVNKEDINKVMNFIKNNSYIQDGLIKANPFAFNNDGIAMAVDGRMSYNSTLSKLIKKYINERKLNGELSKVSGSDFYNYLEEYYNYVFSSEYGLRKLNEDFGVSEDGIYELNESEIVNLKDIISLILKVKNPSFTISDYIRHFEDCSNNLSQERKEDNIRNIKYGNIKEIPEELRSRTNDMLLYAIWTMNEKYQNVYGVVGAISDYVMTGNGRYITSYKDLRNSIVKSNFRDEMNYILQVDGVDLFHYAYELLNKKEQTKEKEIVRSTEEKFIIITIREILEVMGRKYGESVARKNLENYISTGNALQLTRENNLRYRVDNSNFRYNLLTILQERGLKLSDYLNIVGNDLVIDKELYLERAILETYMKQINNGTPNNIALNIVISSLYGLIVNGKYIGFTRDNGARENLINNVSPYHVMEIITKELNRDEIELSELESYVRTYIEKVIENNRGVVL